MIKHTTLVLLVILVSLSQLFAGRLNEHSKEHFRFNRLPSYFVKNQGQLADSAKYYYRSSSSHLLFYNNAFLLQCIKACNPENQNRTEPDKNYGVTNKLSVLNLRISYSGSNPHPDFVESDILPSKSNYFFGNDPNKWDRDVINFKSLIYKNLYNNIDVRFHTPTDVLENEYIIHPGGDPNKITIKYEGAESLELSDSTTLIIHTKAGPLMEKIPSAFQEINGIKFRVNVGYMIISSNQIKFKSSAFNNAYDMVIDPYLIYSTFIGGNAEESASGADKDSQGDLYITGYNWAGLFPTTPGSYDTAYNGPYTDAVILKLNSSGSNLIYSTYLGGSGQSYPYYGADFGQAIKVIQATHEVVVVGMTASPDFPVTQGAYQTFNAGSFDVFVTKLNSSGDSLVFSTLVGTPDYQVVGTFWDTVGPPPSHYAISVYGDGIFDIDAAGNIYVTGSTGIFFPVTPGCYQPLFGGGLYDAFVFKMNPSGTNLIYSTYLGGSEDDRGMCVKVDSAGNAYVAGVTHGGFPVTTGAFQTAYAGGKHDLFITKLNPSGSAIIYSTYLGSPGDDYIYSGMYLDESGRVTLTGYTENGFPTTSGAYDTSFMTTSLDKTIFLSRLNTTGTNLVFSSYFGEGHAMCMDITSSKNILIAGWTHDPNFPTTFCAYDTTLHHDWAGWGDAFLAEFDSVATNLLYSTFLGGSSSEWASAVKADVDSVFVAGGTCSADFPVTPGAYSTNIGPDTEDIFALKLALPKPINAPIIVSNPICIGRVISFSCPVPNLYQYSWNFGDSTISNVQNPTHVFNQAGIYHLSLRITDTCGNIYTNSVIINVFPQQHIQNNLIICQGDSVCVAGHYYHMSGAYIDSVHTIAGCDSIITTNLTVNSINQITINFSICQGDSVLSAGHYYLVAGIYFDTLQNIMACDSNITTILNVNPLPVVNLGPDTSFCQGDSIKLNAQNIGSSFTWSNGVTSQVINIQNPGIYAVTVTDTHGCKSADTCVVAMLPLPFVTVGPPNPVICSDSSITLVGSGADTYTWSPYLYLSSNTGTNVTTTPLASITYQLTGTTSQGCSKDTSIFIKVIPSPVSSLADSIRICYGSAVNLDPGICDSCSYLWSTGATTRIITAADTGTYWVKVFNTACHISDSIKVKDCVEIWVPNVFTPNGDNVNDEFHPKVKNITQFEMLIFNRWGSQIFSTTDYIHGWDGKFKGHNCAEGVYYYLIKYSGPGPGTSNLRGTKSGAVTLLR